MRAALYGRYSSDNQRDRSITDQFLQCEQRAAREGWEVTMRYEDRAISGTTAERPGYQQMLKDAKAGLFDILLIDDLSRLSRDTIECEKVRRRMVFQNIRLIGCSDGVDTGQENHELITGVKAIVNQTFIKDLRQKIKRGMIGQAERKFWNGGRVFGYRLVPETDPNKTDPYGNPAKIGTRLAIDPEQAKIVRWIFERYNEGQSPLTIVTELNRLGVPSPGASYRNRLFPHGARWSALSLHGDVERGTGLLHQNLYRGVAFWGRSFRQRDPDTGKARNVWRPRTEWVEQHIPELQIIDDALWQSVQEKRRQVSQGVNALRASLHSRVNSTGRRPKFLLSGLLKCGVCGRPFIVCESTRYGCGGRLRGGEHCCANGLRVERRLVEELVLNQIKDDLFNEEAYEEFRQWAIKAEAERLRGQKPAQQQASKQLAIVERELSNILTAIKAGIVTASTKAELEKAEAERARLLKLLKQKPAEPLATKLTDLIGGFKKMLGELANVTQLQVDKARGVIKNLVGEIVLQPTADGEQRYLTAVLSADYAGLERVLLGDKIKLVAVTRIERVTRGL